MDFHLDENQTILDLIGKIKKTRKKKYKILSDRNSILYQEKNRKLLKKAINSLKKEIIILTDDNSLYKSLIKENIHSELVELKKNRDNKSITNIKLPLIYNDNGKFTNYSRIIIAIIISILILSFQFSYASIRLFPNITNKTVSMKIEFCNEKCILPYSIKYLALDHEINKEYDFISTGQKFSGTLSKGVVTFFNLGETKLELLKNTRIQNEEGLVFTADQKIFLPAATYLEGKIVAGQVDIPVTSREKDAFDNIIGSRGNLQKGSFYLPGLSEKEKGKIWAEVKTPFTGGTNISNSIVSKSDLEEFVLFVKQDVVLTAANEVKSSLPSIYPNHILNENFIQYLPVKISFENLPEENQEIKSTKVKVNATITFYLLPLDEIEKQVLQFSEKHLISEIEEINSVSLENLDLFNIKPIEENGNFQADLVAPYFVKRNFNINSSSIKHFQDKLVGKNFDEARKFILDRFPNIKITISSWPPWRNSLPLDPGQIKIKIENN